MPADDQLAATLTALSRSIHAVLNVARASSEVTREEFTAVAEDRLADARAAIEQLTKAERFETPKETAEARRHATLFGRSVGDGLDAEREQARAALALLRRILTAHALIENTRGRVHLSLAGSLRIEAADVELIDAITSKE